MHADTIMREIGLRKLTAHLWPPRKVLMNLYRLVCYTPEARHQCLVKPDTKPSDLCESARKS